MNREEMRGLLEGVARGDVLPDDALASISLSPIRDLGFAQVDTARGVRQGVGEVVYGAGKDARQIDGIVRALESSGQDHVLVTRISPEKNDELARRRATDGLEAPSYHPTSQLCIVGGMPTPTGIGTILVVAAGTSDLPVAEEAALTAQFLGNDVQLVMDVGVAGIHRLLAHADDVARASVVIAIAGMEGALASVVGGLTSAPVIAVPTSVGYGASYGGLAALLAMLNSCASGVSVVNIDNGFGAGYQAHLINHVGRPSHTNDSEGE
ncbi:MAG: nickel pincer cofactor biosynthesis protein LarB [Atopobiaceae bacterium]|nr:nickel pincer cofactor biosynthesis protein LarB [Atopobiaceae bacterium]